jgi:hypothetical protein
MSHISEAGISISEVTRRKIFDYLTINRINWSGRREELDFLASLYDLRKMPTTDYRTHQYPTAYEDIHKHRVMNDDWGGHYWVFTDSRFNLLWCPDESFLKFLCEMLHPTSWVDSRPKLSWEESESQETEGKEVFKLQTALNNYLVVDGWELYIDSYISEEPLFSFRISTARNIPLENVKTLTEKIDSAYIARQISRLSENVDKDPAAAIGASKEFLETLCKYIIKERGGITSPRADFGEINSAARNLLNLLPQNVDNEKLGSQSMKKVLGAVGSILSGITELRNLYGTGHGKDSQAVGLIATQAHLVVGLAASLGKFLFEVHTEASRR